MPGLTPLFAPPAGRRPRAALFLSGSGSNAERILARHAQQAAPAFDPVVLVTDRPDESRAAALAAQFGLPVLAHDIRAWYRARGLTRVSLATAEGRAAREEWTAALWAQLAPGAQYAVDFGIFAGFIPLTNLTRHLPCLNVHPGDLTVLVDGQRHLVGLHTIPIERALLAGQTQLRSSVILADPYGGAGADMDSGHLLGVSGPVPVDWQGLDLAAARQLAAARPAERPPKGYADALEALAAHNQDALKRGGDWIVFPPVVDAFAAGRYTHDGHGALHYRHDDGAWRPVLTVEYTATSATPWPLAPALSSAATVAQHQAAILDQFTRQAVPFSKMAEHAHALDQMRALAAVRTDDTVLDVACGPGLVACAFAPHVRQVTGIDLVPGMIERARVLQAEQKLGNLAWQVGDVTKLPFADASFSLVLTRYTFHHFLTPLAVYAEMLRVCTPGGRVMVVDAAPAPDKRAAYDRVETLRDPSHTRALTPQELVQAAVDLGLQDIRTGWYKVETALETTLKNSFPNPGDADRVRQLFRADLGRDTLGMDVHEQDGALYFAFPILIVVGTKPA